MTQALIETAEGLFDGRLTYVSENALSRPELQALYDYCSNREIFAFKTAEHRMWYILLIAAILEDL